MNDEKCPCCGNHCSKDALSCGRGRDYFSSLNSNLEDETIEEKIIRDLSRCGHMLHHNRDLKADEFLNGFSSDELEELHKLLSKIHHNN